MADWPGNPYYATCKGYQNDLKADDKGGTEKESATMNTTDAPLTINGRLVQIAWRLLLILEKTDEILEYKATTGESQPSQGKKGKPVFAPV